MFLIPLATALVFSTVATFSSDPIMDDRTWVIAPMFYCTAIICFVLEYREER